MSDSTGFRLQKSLEILHKTNWILKVYYLEATVIGFFKIFKKESEQVLKKKKPTTNNAVSIRLW